MEPSDADFTGDDLGPPDATQVAAEGIDPLRLSSEWLEEVRRRSALIDAGSMSVADWEAVRVRTRRSAGLET